MMSTGDKTSGLRYETSVQSGSAEAEGGISELDALMPSPAGTQQPEDRASPAPASERSFLSFYGLRENPFKDSVNPAFFYRTDGHGEALERMLMAVEHDVSLGMVTGPSGTGKTLITQLLLDSLDADKVRAVLILVSPGLSKTGLLREILAELNVALPAGINRTQELLKLLSNCIIDLYHKGQKLVIVIDECHFLSSDNLHILRTISNIEVPERKLTTCLLFGEERFAARLEHPSHASLRNRMFMIGLLGSMGAADTAQYVKFRLMVAGRLADLFDADALAAVHRHSGGVGRNINKLCMLCLLHGFAKRLARLDEPLVTRCAGLL
jgi:general secretion pathway protein A